MAMRAYWAEDKAYPEECGGTIIASSDEEALTIACRMLNVGRDELNLYTAETADDALVKARLEELDDAMDKAARAEREACAVIALNRSRWAAIGIAQWAARYEAAAIELAIRERGGK